MKGARTRDEHVSTVQKKGFETMKFKDDEEILHDQLLEYCSWIVNDCLPYLKKPPVVCTTLSEILAEKVMFENEFYKPFKNNLKKCRELFKEIDIHSRFLQTPYDRLHFTSEHLRSLLKKLGSNVEKRMTHLRKEKEFLHLLWKVESWCDRASDLCLVHRNTSFENSPTDGRIENFLVTHPPLTDTQLEEFVEHAGNFGDRSIGHRAAVLGNRCRQLKLALGSRDGKPDLRTSTVSPERTRTDVISDAMPDDVTSDGANGDVKWPETNDDQNLRLRNIRRRLRNQELLYEQLLLEEELHEISERDHIQTATISPPDRNVTPIGRNFNDVHRNYSTLQSHFKENTQKDDSIYLRDRTSETDVPASNSAYSPTRDAENTYQKASNKNLPRTSPYVPSNHGIDLSLGIENRPVLSPQKIIKCNKADKDISGTQVYKNAMKFDGIAQKLAEVRRVNLLDGCNSLKRLCGLETLTATPSGNYRRSAVPSQGLVTSAANLADDVAMGFRSDRSMKYFETGDEERGDCTQISTSISYDPLFPASQNFAVNSHSELSSSCSQSQRYRDGHLRDLEPRSPSARGAATADLAFTSRLDGVNCFDIVNSSRNHGKPRDSADARTVHALKSREDYAREQVVSALGEVDYWTAVKNKERVRLTQFIENSTSRKASEEKYFNAQVQLSRARQYLSRLKGDGFVSNSPTTVDAKINVSSLVREDGAFERFVKDASNFAEDVVNDTNTRWACGEKRSDASLAMERSRFDDRSRSSGERVAMAWNTDTDGHKSEAALDLPTHDLERSPPQSSITVEVCGSKHVSENESDGEFDDDVEDEELVLLCNQSSGGLRDEFRGGSQSELDRTEETFRPKKNDHFDRERENLAANERRIIEWQNNTKNACFEGEPKLSSSNCETPILTDVQRKIALFEKGFRAVDEEVARSSENIVEITEQEKSNIGSRGKSNLYLGQTFHAFKPISEHETEKASSNNENAGSEYEASNSPSFSRHENAEVLHNYVGNETIRTNDLDLDFIDGLVNVDFDHHGDMKESVVEVDNKPTKLDFNDNVEISPENFEGGSKLHVDYLKDADLSDGEMLEIEESLKEVSYVKETVDETDRADPPEVCRDLLPGIENLDDVDVLNRIIDELMISDCERTGEIICDNLTTTVGCDLSEGDPLTSEDGIGCRIDRCGSGLSVNNDDLASALQAIEKDVKLSVGDEVKDSENCSEVEADGNGEVIVDNDDALDTAWDDGDETRSKTEVRKHEDGEVKDLRSSPSNTDENGSTVIEEANIMPDNNDVADALDDDRDKTLLKDTSEFASYKTDGDQLVQDGKPSNDDSSNSDVNLASDRNNEACYGLDSDAQPLERREMFYSGSENIEKNSDGLGGAKDTYFAGDLNSDLLFTQTDKLDELQTKDSKESIQNCTSEKTNEADGKSRAVDSKDGKRHSLYAVVNGGTVEANFTYTTAHASIGMSGNESAQDEIALSKSESHGSEPTVGLDIEIALDTSDDVEVNELSDLIGLLRSDGDELSGQESLDDEDITRILEKSEVVASEVTTALLNEQIQVEQPRVDDGRMSMGPRFMSATKMDYDDFNRVLDDIEEEKSEYEDSTDCSGIAMEKSSGEKNMMEISCNPMPNPFSCRDVSSDKKASFCSSVVIDLGSESIKAGFSIDEQPRVMLPSVVGHPRKMDGRFKGHYIGNEAKHLHHALNLQNLMRNGLVQDWELMVKALNEVYEELHCDAVQYPVLICEPVLVPKSHREETLQVMFESHNVPALYLSSQASLALFATGRTTGVVYDCGHGKSHSVPVYEGYAMKHATSITHFAGCELTACLSRMLRSRGVTMETHAEVDVVNAIKEKLCYVVVDYDSETLAYHNEERKNAAYTLPDGKRILIGSERFRCPELLFTPSLMGLETDGVHDMIFQSVFRCDVDLRSSLLENIVIAGGSTMFSGFRRRLHFELCKLFGTRSQDAINIDAPEDRNLLAWQGGAMLSRLSSFQSMWITSSEYDEFGPSIVHTKCV